MFQALPPAETVKLSRDESKLNSVSFSVAARNMSAASVAVVVDSDRSLTDVSLVSDAPISDKSVFICSKNTCSLPLT